METCPDSAGLRARVAEWKQQGRKVALVPTMGNLHAGHLSLIDQARRHADKVVVIVFVNPLQFGPNDDLASYPRTPEEDSAKLAAAGVDVLFAPRVDEMYPQEQGIATVHVPGLDDRLEGASRPGHFAGVATVVAKLFNMATPDAAVFGNKDYQQLVVIRRMAVGLGFPVAIVGAATVREPDGLAMSSRNRYLDAPERARAPGLFRALSAAAEELRTGGRDFAALEARAIRDMEAAGFRPDYVAVRDPETLGQPTAEAARLVVLGAGRLGRARLIDNIVIDESG
jgi:pantoate--beta-alanine ligase